MQQAKFPKLPGKFHTPRQTIKTSAPLGTISKEAPCQCAGSDKLKRCLDSEVRSAGKSSSRGENTRNLQELIPGTPRPRHILLVRVHVRTCEPGALSNAADLNSKSTYPCGALWNAPTHRLGESARLPKRRAGLALRPKVLSWQPSGRPPQPASHQMQN